MEKLEKLEKLPLEILNFWWQAGMAKWFKGGVEFDAEIQEKYGDVVEKALQGAYEEWATSPHGALALIIVLDQFTRNIYRGSARSFAGDERALSLAKSSIERQFDHVFPHQARTFFYLPFEHAEDMAMQEMSVDLFRQLNIDPTYLYALVHMDVIRRFGRFPHRNKILGRHSSAAEIAFLESGGFSG